MTKISKETADKSLINPESEPKLGELMAAEARRIESERATPDWLHSPEFKRVINHFISIERKSYLHERNELFGKIMRISRKICSVPIQNLAEIEKVIILSLMELFETDIGGSLGVVEDESSLKLEVKFLELPAIETVPADGREIVRALELLEPGHLISEDEPTIITDYLKHGFTLIRLSPDQQKATPTEGVGVDYWEPFYGSSGEAITILFFDQSDAAHQMSEKAQWVFAAIQEMIKNFYFNALEFDRLKREYREKLKNVATK